jgi:hypothetical protein
MSLSEAAKSQGLNTPTTYLSNDFGFLSDGFDLTFVINLCSSYGCLVSKFDIYVHSFISAFCCKKRDGFGVPYITPERGNFLSLFVSSLREKRTQTTQTKKQTLVI